MHLLKHFKNLSLHPKNAEELKGLILQLAVQGKLTAKWRGENPDIEPASELLKRIEAEKAQLIKEKKIKKEKALPEISAEEIPFEIPSSWEWCRFGSSILLISGRDLTPLEYSDTELTYPYLTGASQIQNDKIILARWTDRPKVISEIGDLLISCKGTVGKTVINNIGQLHIARQIMAIRSFHLLSVRYCKLFIDRFVSDLQDVSKSMIPGISREDVMNLPFPLPPLEEQKEIVSIVNQLFAEVEQLEALTKERIQLKEDFATSALAQLSTGDTDKEWSFLQTHFHTFFDQKSNIKKLRESILQLAVQGKLTHHWRAKNPDTEHASELLKRIEVEKAQLIKEKKIKKEKALPEISAEEIPYELPKGWVWCRLKNLGIITGGGTPSKGNSNYWGGEIPWVSPKDMKSDFISDTQDKVTEEGVSNSSTKLIPIGSLLIVGRSGILKRTVPISINQVECTVNQDMKVIIPFLKELNIFIRLALMGMEKRLLKDFVKYGMTVHSLKYSEFEQMTFPLPPLQESEAIVEKVNTLMGLCDRLEQEIGQGTQELEQLMQSSLREVFSHSSAL